jgi:Icc-related predicted phosphoesterase
VVRSILEEAGIRVLECETEAVSTGELRVGVAGTKGFAGGFAGGRASDFGEPEMKTFIGHTKALSTGLRHSLESLDTDLRIALLHYSPVPDTLAGENLQVYPFLGSYLLGEAVDRVGADLVIHGHAHRGSEVGATPGGVPVRNVAQPVIGRPYNLYVMEPEDSRESRESQSA